MRNCDNCEYGSYGLDCNTGIETLYCRETEYEYEVDPNGVCDEHQFIDGYEDEKNFIVYDDSYLGPGFFIVNQKDDKVASFLKIYVTGDNDSPCYALRAFSYNDLINIDNEFSGIEFNFRDYEDYVNGLYNVFSDLCINVGSKIESVGKQDKNNITMLLNSHRVRFIVSKEASINTSENYIDINIGDTQTCPFYDEIKKFYNALVNLVPSFISEEQVQKIIKFNNKLI